MIYWPLSNWCAAYADSSKLKSANKVWFPEDPRVQKCTRFSDSNVNAWISTVSQNKFSPATTLRLYALNGHQQVAIPFAMLTNMKVCGKCFPKN